MMPLDVRQRSEAVVLDFVQEIGMVERPRNAEQCGRRDEREDAFMVSMKTAEIQLKRS